MGSPESGAASIGGQEYEFRSYGDAIEFQETCWELSVDFKVNDLSLD